MSEFLLANSKQLLINKDVYTSSAGGQSCRYKSVLHVQHFAICPLLCSSDPAESACEQSQCDCSSAPPACLSRGKLLLHCFLQGLKAGLSDGTGEQVFVFMADSNNNKQNENLLTGKTCCQQDVFHFSHFSLKTT